MLSNTGMKGKPVPEFLIYRSSAGSGKTQALATVYLRLLLCRKADFRNVLAITFTNKAAGEMKERVLGLLQMFGAGITHSDYHESMLMELADEAGISREALCQRAAAIHSDILHHYSDFSIGTIDSFMHRIIRSFALELNLSFAFEVQLETDQFIRLTIDDLLETAGEDPGLTNHLVQFTRLMLEDEKSWDITEGLVQFTRFLTAEVSLSPLELLSKVKVDLRNISQKNLEELNRLASAWSHLLETMHRLVVESGFTMDDFKYKSRGSLYTTVQGMLNEANYAKIFQRHESAARMVGWMEENQPFYDKGLSASDRDRMEELGVVLRDLWKTLIESVDRHYPEYLTRMLVQQELPNLELSRQIRSQMQQTMDRENLIPIYEFNRLIWNIIRNQPVPFIYERTSERYDHFLVDEFQDTSALQWFNLLPLIENSLSQGGVNMVVGDAKQAIYRWRNGDVWQFVKLPELNRIEGDVVMEQREQALKRYAVSKTLNFNYRSASEIISFNNDFFQWLSERHPDLLGTIYQGHRQNKGSSSPPGYVEVHLIPVQEGFLVADYDEEMASVTYQKVKEVIEASNGEIPLSDICILVRRNSEASILAARLIEGGIDVVSSQSFMLGVFPEPVILRALLGLLVTPGDSVQAAILATRLHHAGRVDADVLHRFLASVSTEIKNHGSLYTLLDDLLAAAGIHQKMLNYQGLPLYEVCEQMIRDFIPSGKASVAVQHLLDLTARFVASNGNDPGSFLKHLDEAFQTSIPLPETGKALQIMTVHKAKGLEFPVVIYAFASEAPEQGNNRSKRIWATNQTPEKFGELPVLLLPLKKDLAATPYKDEWDRESSAMFQDMANVVYVALTRAVRQLYVISSPHGRKSTQTGHLYDLLGEFVRQNDTFTTTNDIQWSSGDRNAAMPARTSTTGQTLQMPGWISYSWQDRISVRSVRSVQHETTTRSQAMARGTMVHTLLAEMDPVEGIDGVLKRYVHEGAVTESEAALLRNELDGLLSMEEVQRFFDPKHPIKREATLIATDGRILRPDRVVMAQEEVWVLDFKTGAPRPSDREQVKTYCDVIAQMGYPLVRGYLLYLDRRELIPL